MSGYTCESETFEYLGKFKQMWVNEERFWSVLKMISILFS